MKIYSSKGHSFPSSFGFSGSAGKSSVRTHMRAPKASRPRPQMTPHMAEGGANWIAGATKNKGALHRALGVPEGQKISAKKMAQAANSKNPTMRKRAALANTLSKLHKADGGSVDLLPRADSLTTPQTPGDSQNPVKFQDFKRGGKVKSAGATMGKGFRSSPLVSKC